MTAMGKTNITIDTVVMRNDKKFMASPVGDEIVMMSMESGNYIGMNSVATVIWEKLKQPISVKELIAFLLDNYDIDKEECERKTLKYLNDLVKEEMLVTTK